MPATLMKNIRVIAAVVCYDLLSQQSSMKQDDQFKFCFNYFHGNDDQNIVSQVDLLLRGYRYHKQLYDIEKSPLVTDRDTADATESTAPDDIYVLKQRYSTSHMRFVRGKHFNKESLSAPTKARLKERVTGRNIYDLALQMIRNLKKASALADEWLDTEGNVPSGKTWEDLYDHVLSKSNDIS